MTKIALVPMTENVNLKHFAQMLSKIRLINPTVKSTPILTSQNICKSNRHFAQAKKNSTLERALLKVLKQKESQNSTCIYLTDVSPTAWTKRCMERADQVILIGEAKNWNNQTAIGKNYFQYANMIENKNHLVLNYPTKNEANHQKIKWLLPTTIENKYHLSIFSKRDFEILAILLMQNKVAQSLDVLTEAA